MSGPPPTKRHSISGPVPVSLAQNGMLLSNSAFPQQLAAAVAAQQQMNGLNKLPVSGNNPLSGLPPNFMGQARSEASQPNGQLLPQNVLQQQQQQQIQQMLYQQQQQLQQQLMKGQMKPPQQLSGTAQHQQAQQQQHAQWMQARLMEQQRAQQHVSCLSFVVEI